MTTEPVYKALLPRILIAGLPKSIFTGILGAGTVVIVGLQQYWFGVIVLAVYIAARALTKVDDYLIEETIKAIMQPQEFF